MRSGSIGLTVIRVAVAMVLFLAGVPRPARSERILHWILFVLAAYLIYRAFEVRRPVWVVIWGVAAFVFNPAFPLALPRRTWVEAEVTMGVLLIVSVLLMDRHEV